MPRAHEHLMPHQRRLAHALVPWVLALACLLACGCSTTTITEEQPSKPVSQVIPATLAIVHTGGARGSFSADGVACPAVAARLAHDLREEGFDVLLLDSGDTLHGGDPTDLSYGEDAIGFLNAAGYDALALGTSELDLGQETLRARDLQGDFPLLSANVTTDEDAPQVMPHEVFALSDGRTIGVFALTAPAAATQASPLALRGITLSTDDLAAIAQQQVGELRSEGCRLIVCLTNLGDGTDSQLDATTLASQVSGIDILLDAGAEEGHKVVKDASDDETLVVETAAAPGAVSVVTWARGTLSVTPHKVEQGEATDEQVDALVTQTNIELEHRLSQVLTKAGFVVPLPQGAEESTLGDLTSDAILWQARRSAPDAPDAAVITNGSLAAAIDEGDVTRGDALLVMPQATSRLCVVEVSGTQLQETLEDAIAAAQDDPTHMPQVSGIACAIDAKDAHRPKVSITEVGGHAFSPTETYRIATLEPLLLAELEQADDETVTADVLSATTRLDVSGGEALASYLARKCKGNLPERYHEPQKRLVTKTGTKS